MKKILLFSLPSISVDKVLSRTANILAEKYEIIYFNTSSFNKRKASDRIKLHRRNYPDYKDGYGRDIVDMGNSIFAFGYTLLRTTISLLDFLHSQIEGEKPHLILHSHLAVWGKLFANHHRIPAISLFTTFYMQRTLMSKVRSYNELDANVNLPTSIIDAKNFNKARDFLKEKLILQEDIEVHDIYINSQKVNILFLLPVLQPKCSLPSSCNFLGYPLAEIINEKSILKPPLIYISLGTILSYDKAILKILITSISKINVRCVISSSNNYIALDDLPENITIYDYVNQTEILESASVFITHGGMSSVQESIYTNTPMIVIPMIPEQMLTARIISELELGVFIPFRSIDEEKIIDKIQFILNNYEFFQNSFRKVIKISSQESDKVLMEIFDHQLSKML